MFSLCIFANILVASKYGVRHLQCKKKKQTSLSVARTSTFSVLTLMVTHRDYCVAIEGTVVAAGWGDPWTQFRNPFYLLAFHTPKYVNMGSRFTTQETPLKFHLKMKWCRMTMWVNLFKTSRVMPQQTVTVFTHLCNWVQLNIPSLQKLWQKPRKWGQSFIKLYLIQCNTPRSICLVSTVPIK